MRGSVDYYTISNINFNDVSVGTSTPAINIVAFKYLSISNLYFNGMINEEVNSEDNRMVNINQIDLSSYKYANIEDIEITNSQIDFLEIKQISGELSQNEASFTLKNVNYHD